MQLLHIKFLGVMGVGAALMLAGCGGGSSPKPDNNGPFTVDASIESSDFFDSNDDRYYDIFITEVARNGTAEVEMISDDLDSQVFVYRRDSGGDYDLIADDDDSGDASDALVRFDVRRGEVYRVVATSSRKRETGDYRIFFSRELGRPGVVLPRQNGSTIQGVELPRVQAKGAVEKRTK